MPFGLVFSDFAEMHDCRPSISTGTASAPGYFNGKLLFLAADVQLRDARRDGGGVLEKLFL